MSGVVERVTFTSGRPDFSRRELGGRSQSGRAALCHVGPVWLRGVVRALKPAAFLRIVL